MGLKLDISVTPADVRRAVPQTVTLPKSYTIDRVFVCGEEWTFERTEQGVKLLAPVQK